MHFLPQTLGHAFEESVTARKDQIAPQIPPQVVLTALNRVKAILLHAIKLVVSMGRLKNSLCTLEPLSTECYFAPIREFKLLFTSAALRSLFDSLVKVSDHIAHCLFHFAHNFVVLRCLHEDTFLSQDLPQIL